MIEEGSEGCVIKYNNIVSKYSINNFSIHTEFNNFKLLPINNFYVNPTKVFLSIVSDQDEIDFILDSCVKLKNRFRKNSTLFRLDMPYIDGYTLKYFFHNMLYLEYNFDKWYIFIKNFLILIFNIIKFNNDGFCHNDLHLNNIMYNGNKFIIIDFTSLTFNKKCNDDQNTLFEYLIRIIYISIEHEKIKQYLYDNCIISNLNLLNYNGYNLFIELYDLFNN